jgi:hypothetical protein
MLDGALKVKKHNKNKIKNPKKTKIKKPDMAET